MSASDDGPGTREVARRLFATEYQDASLSYSESEEERAPNYVITPTGARINRMFIAGVFTETEQVNEDMLRARIVDPTGAFVSYAGQYQPDALSFFERTNPPEFVAMTGKARTFQPEDSDRVFTSVRPESVNAVDADTRDRWVVSAAESTLRRVAAYDAALETGLAGEELADHLRERGVDESLATGIPLAIDHYGTTRAYLDAVRQVAVDALEVVAGEREEVRSLDLAPDEGDDVEIGPIPEEYAPEGGEPAEAGAAESEPEPASEEVEAAPEAVETQAPGTEATPPDAEPTEPASVPESPESAPEEPEPAPGMTAASTEESETATEESEATETGFDSEDIEAAGEEPGEEPVAPADEVAVESSAAETAPTSEPDEIPGAESGFDSEDIEAAGEEPGEEPVASEDEASIESSVAETAPTSEPEELGDFEAGGLGETSTEAGTEETAEAETSEAAEAAEAEADLDEEGMYELDEEERREVEEEYGVEFASGAEVGEPGEAGIEAPEPEAEDLETETTETEAADLGEADEEIAEEVEETEESSEAEAAEEGESEPAPAESAEVDLESVAVEKMAELDDGNGAQREEVIAAVVDEYGADPGAVDDAIQDALMDGRCYEPGDNRLKAI